jgi:hypothetical protein
MIDSQQEANGASAQVGIDEKPGFSLGIFQWYDLNKLLSVSGCSVATIVGGELDGVAFGGFCACLVCTSARCNLAQLARLIDGFQQTDAKLLFMIQYLYLPFSYSYSMY